MIETVGEIAGRCEAATGPDRELDAAIAQALGERISYHPREPQPYIDRGGTMGFMPLPAYTASLDAAMTLVPPDRWHEIKGPRKYLNIPTSSPNYWSAYLSSYDYEVDAMGWAATPALALCVASLKVRAHLGAHP